ncbi:MAG: hypothetical protein ACK5IM_06525 [Demequina sp.]|uniref:hypothetical protein n=1 Tax=Demequina sp. TaxID=2050685 RepID=UPI003A89D262
MEIYRSRSSQVWGWLCVGLGAAILLIQLIGSGLNGFSVGFGVAVAFAAVGAAAFLRPAVAVGRDAVEFRNVTQTVAIPFSRLAGLEAHWSLELVGDDGTKVGSFAAPARSGRDRLKSPEDGASAEVATLITSAWDAYRAAPTTAAPTTAVSSPVPARADASADGSDAGGAFTRRPDLVGIGLVAAALAGIALAVFG